MILPESWQYTFNKVFFFIFFLGNTFVYCFLYHPKNVQKRHQFK